MSYALKVLHLRGHGNYDHCIQKVKPKIKLNKQLLL